MSKTASAKKRVRKIRKTAVRRTTKKTTKEKAQDKISNSANIIKKALTYLVVITAAAILGWWFGINFLAK